jgi:hypothetical protein
LLFKRNPIHDLWIRHAKFISQRLNHACDPAPHKKAAPTRREKSIKPTRRRFYAVVKSLQKGSGIGMLKTIIGAAQVQGLPYLRVHISIQEGTHPWPKSFRSLGKGPVLGAGAPPKPMTLDMLE